MTTAMIMGLLAHWSTYYTVALNVCAGILILMGFATFVVKLTPFTKDDIFMHSLNVRVLKAFSILPYWGTNPLQKKLFEIVKEMDQKSQEAEIQANDPEIDQSEDPK